MSDHNALVYKAGEDLRQFHNTDLPASELGNFVTTYFSMLSAEKNNKMLIVQTYNGRRFYFVRDKRHGHRGWSSVQGSELYRASEVLELLEAGGGQKLDTRMLVEFLAKLNNRMEDN